MVDGLDPATGPAPGKYFADELSTKARMGDAQMLKREPTAFEVACEIHARLKARTNEFERLLNTMPRELQYLADAALRRMFQGMLRRLDQVD